MPNQSINTVSVVLFAAFLFSQCLYAREVSDEFTKTYRAYNAAYAQGNFARAADLAEKAVVMAVKELGEKHEKTAVMQINLGHVLVLLGKIDEAEPHLVRARSVIEKLHGPDHVNLVTVYEDMAKILAARKKLDESRAQLDSAIEIIVKQRSENHPQIADLLIQQGTLDLAKNDMPTAEQSFLRALKIYESNYGKDDPRSAGVISLLGDINVLKNDLVAAEKSYQDALRVFEASLVEDDPRIINTHVRLGKLYVATGNDQFHHHADRVIALSKLPDNPAKPLFILQPKYPVFKSGRKPQGWTLLEFTILASGRVSGVKVVESMPPKLFDSVALEAAKKWRFLPKVVNGKRVNQKTTRARIVFRHDKIDVHLGEMT